MKKHDNQNDKFLGHGLAVSLLRPHWKDITILMENRIRCETPT